MTENLGNATRVGERRRHTGMEPITMYTNTGMLFAEPSLLEGLGRAVDFGGFLNEYNSSPSGEMADFLALRGDWLTVGDDLYRAVTRYAAEYVSR